MKPEKKYLIDNLPKDKIDLDEVVKTKDKIAGYNQACEEWEKWLPSEEEIKKLLEKYSYRFEGDGSAYADITKQVIAKAIFKRLRGEK